MTRRRISGLLAVILANALHCTAVAAAAPVPPYPERPIRLVVGFPPGGTADILARAVGREFTEAWQQQVVVDNRPGAGSLIGSELVAKAAPDGYTLLVVSSSHAVTASAVGKRSGYDPVQSFTPISLIAATPLALLAGASAPVKTMRELLTFARANPGRLNYGSSGTGSTTHLAGELLDKLGGIRLVHVPYKGGAPSMNELIGGQIDLLVISLPSAIPQIRSAKATGLAVTASRRSTFLPELPTVAESGVAGYEALQWYAVLAPAGMKADLAQALNAQVTRAVRSPKMVDLLAKLGADPVTGTLAECRAYLQSEVAKWDAIVRQLGLSPQ